MTDGPESYEFCVGPDEALGRRYKLASGGVILRGERYIPGEREWRLDHEVLNEQRFAEASPDTVASLVSGREDLLLPCADRPTTRPAELAESRSKRLAWVEGAILESWRIVEDEENRITMELPFARPGTWDYDYEFDKISEVKHAYVTLEALAEERRAMLWNHEQQRTRTYD